MVIKMKCHIKDSFYFDTQQHCKCVPDTRYNKFQPTDLDFVELGEHHKQTALTRKLILLPSFPPTNLSSRFSFSQCFPSLSSCPCFSWITACAKRACLLQTLSPRLHLTSTFTNLREAFSCFNTSDTTSFLPVVILPIRRLCRTELKSLI